MQKASYMQAKLIADTINKNVMRNFKFSILEVFAFNTPDEVILQREAYWKNVLISREFGYNRN